MKPRHLTKTDDMRDRYARTIDKSLWQKRWASVNPIFRKNGLQRGLKDTPPPPPIAHVINGLCTRGYMGQNDKTWDL